MIKIGTALFEATEQLEKEKGISQEVLINALKDALIAAYKKHIKDREAENITAILDDENGEIGVFRSKVVVENVENPDLEITLNEALELDDSAELEDEIMIDVTPEDFGRIAAQSAKQVLTQRIREAERKMVLDEFMSKKGTLITGIVQRRDDRNNVIVNIGKTDAIMPYKEQLPGEQYKSGNRIRIFVLNVKETQRLPQVIVSQAHSAIVRELFELEVPEIEDGIVEIKSIAREAGYRTKLAVWSNDPSVDSVGACIGPRGTRIQTIVHELKNEKIDIVRYSPDPVEYIVNALSPARILSVDILADDENAHEALVIVPDDQLSLAIGRDGQNVRLAHRLTNWKIDIKSESQAREMELNKVDEVYEEEPAETVPEETVSEETAEETSVETPSDAEIPEDIKEEPAEAVVTDETAEEAKEASEEAPEEKPKKKTTKKASEASEEEKPKKKAPAKKSSDEEEKPKKKTTKKKTEE